VTKLFPFLFVLIVSVCVSSPAQMRMPTMHGNVPHLSQQEPVVFPQQQTKLDPVQLQHQAQELLNLAESLQPDIDSVNRGVLPKDTIDKLRRLEKAAKHLRGELTP